VSKEIEYNYKKVFCISCGKFKAVPIDARKCPVCETKIECGGSLLQNGIGRNCKQNSPLLQIYKRYKIKSLIVCHIKDVLATGV